MEQVIFTIINFNNVCKDNSNVVFFRAESLEEAVEQTNKTMLNQTDNVELYKADELSLFNETYISDDLVYMTPDFAEFMNMINIITSEL